MSNASYHERRTDPQAARAARGRDAIAILAARVSALVARSLGHGGTSIPGRVAERVAPGITGRVADDLGSIVVVSGTNGKTTTTRLISHILERAGEHTVTNGSGANMGQGVTSALVAGSGLDGRGHDIDAIAVLEVDEAVLADVVEELPVTVLVATNLFRDQLDRFGETDEIVRRWSVALRSLGPTAVVVSCADDPRLARLVAGWAGPTSAFGASGPPLRPTHDGLTLDVSRCPWCHGRLSYAWTTIGHMGAFACHDCGSRRSDPTVAVRVVESYGLDGQKVAFRADDGGAEVVVRLRLPGLANTYNAAAAVAAAIALGIPLRTAVGTLDDATSAWGRYEELEIDGRRVVLALGKNPASLAELIRIGAESPIAAVLLAMNDEFQDGRDVSWYWDVDPLPLLTGRTWAVTGQGAADFILRTKYAHDAATPTNARIIVDQDPAQGLDQLVDTTSRGDTIFAVATYTAMLGLRASLVGRGLAPIAPR